MAGVAFALFVVVVVARQVLWPLDSSNGCLLVEMYVRTGCRMVEWRLLQTGDQLVCNCFPRWPFLTSNEGLSC